MALIPAQPQSVLQDTAPDDDSAGSEGESFTDGGAIPDVHQTTITEQAFSPGISVTPTPYHEERTGKILGCHIMGAEASILIHEVLVAMRAGSGTLKDLQRTIHIHPALSEVVSRAAGGGEG